MIFSYGESFGDYKLIFMFGGLLSLFDEVKLFVFGDENKIEVWGVIFGENFVDVYFFIVFVDGEYMFI